MKQLTFIRIGCVLPTLLFVFLISMPVLRPSSASAASVEGKIIDVRTKKPFNRVTITVWWHEGENRTNLNLALVHCGYPEKSFSCTLEKDGAFKFIFLFNKGMLYHFRIGGEINGIEYSNLVKDIVYEGGNIKFGLIPLLPR